MTVKFLCSMLSNDVNVAIIHEGQVIAYLPVYYIKSSNRDIFINKIKDYHFSNKKTKEIHIFI